MSYIVKSIGYNVLYQELDEVLCELDGVLKFNRPEINRQWTEKEFPSEYSALCALREINRNGFLTVLEDTGKVMITQGFETGLTSMRIVKLRKD